ncbi:MAG: alkaline ceramidase [Planctomycetaceae bacterium]
MSNRPTPRKHHSFTGRIGIARTDITPPVGIYARNWGAAKHDIADTIHRPLTLTALTISEGNHPPLILVDADLGWWRPLDVYRQFQRRLLSELNLDPSRFVFALTHTHASPPLMEPDPALPGSDLLGPWHESVYQATVNTVRQALADTFDAILDWHPGRCELASVRDLPDPIQNRMICGFNPDQPADDTLMLGRITDSSGTLRATIVNYACHPTTLAWDNTSISPDYIGAMRDTMEAVTGAKALFLQGASGDLAPRYQYVGDPEIADRHGRQLGHAALATLHDMEPAGTQLTFKETRESGAPLAVWRHEPTEVSTNLQAVETKAELDLKDWPTADELEKQRQECDDRALEERLRRKRDIRRSLGDGRTFAVPVTAWRLGDAVLVGSCCEAYSVLQQELRRRFPDYSIVCLNLANGSIGYLPPADLYDKDVYPVWQTPFARGGLERMIETLAAAITKLTHIGGPVNQSASSSNNST